MKKERNNRTLESMEHDDDHPNRRKLLKVLAGGSALVTYASLPTAWHKPVIQTVILPAHAETSPVDEGPGTPVLSGEVTLSDATGGPGDQSFTSDSITSIGCSDEGAGFGADDGCELVATLTQDGQPVEGVEVQLEVTATGDIFIQGENPNPQTATTDASGVASCFDFGSNDLFNISDAETVTFCFSVPADPEIVPYCITLTFSCS